MNEAQSNANNFENATWFNFPQQYDGINIYNVTAGHTAFVRGWAKIWTLVCTLLKSMLFLLYYTDPHIISTPLEDV